jgi:hypothetical protein
MGPFRWLSVSSIEGITGAELLLEPMTGFPPAAVYQKARFDAGMPAVAFFTTDIACEFRRLKDSGVKFRSEPTNIGPAIAAIFEDTCGNLVHLVQAGS